jgi:hypothetical protein
MRAGGGDDLGLKPPWQRPALKGDEAASDPFQGHLVPWSHLGQVGTNPPTPMGG